jgi:hypothetical protein
MSFHSISLMNPQLYYATKTLARWTGVGPVPTDSWWTMLNEEIPTHSSSSQWTQTIQYVFLGGMISDQPGYYMHQDLFNHVRCICHHIDLLHNGSLSWCSVLWEANPLAGLKQSSCNLNHFIEIFTWFQFFPK